MTSPSSAPARPGAIPALTGLRFVAAFVVVLFHMHLMMPTRLPHLAVVGDVLASVVEAGYAGVTLFFVLSGFILAYNYTGTGTSARDFLWARVARVVPVYVFSLVVMAPHFLAEHLHHRRTLLIGGASVLAMVQAWMPSFAAAFNPPAWSLSNEAFFYLSFPLLLPAMVRLRRPSLLAVSLAAWALALAAIALYCLRAPDGLGANATPHVGSWWLDAVKFWPPLHLPSFVMGVALGVAERRRSVAGAAWGGPLAWLTAAATVALIAARVVPYPLQHTAGLAPLAALLIAALATGRGAMARGLAHPVMVRLGEASFSLYLLHVPLLTYVVRAARGRAFDTGAPWFAAAFVLAAVAVSWATLVWIEEPARRRLRRVKRTPTA